MSRRCVSLAALCAALLAGPAVGDAQPAGEAERGRALFAAKQCAGCHLPRGEAGPGPPIEELKRPQGAFALAGRLWNHAPAMFALLRLEGAPWPPISPPEMGDLMAYLEGDPRRDPAPDVARGQRLLVRKGCLKCHSVKGEGARVGPDLSHRRAAYDSATAWASAMWIHTPRMAAKAQEVGVLFPRFADAEMGDVVAFLKGVAR